MLLFGGVALSVRRWAEGETFEKQTEGFEFIYLVITDTRTDGGSLLCETLNAKSEQNNTCSINTPDGDLGLGLGLKNREWRTRLPTRTTDS